MCWSYSSLCNCVLGCRPQVNWFLLRPDFGVSSREVRRAIVTLSAVSACLLIALRLPWPVWLGAPAGLLDGLSQRWPEFFSFPQAGSREVCGTEISCGPEVRVRAKSERECKSEDVNESEGFGFRGRGFACGCCIVPADGGTACCTVPCV